MEGEVVNAVEADKIQLSLTRAPIRQEVAQHGGHIRNLSDNYLWSF
jgi:hypothetical protein